MKEIMIIGRKIELGEQKKDRKKDQNQKKDRKNEENKKSDRRKDEKKEKKIEVKMGIGKKIEGHTV